MIARSFALLALALASAASAQSGADTSADYTVDDNWLCRPGRADPCAAAQDATIVAANGATAAEPFHAAERPAIDCFYVYPTISLDSGGNSDLDAGAEEKHIATQQLGRFAAQCRPFAPVYRQITMAGLRATMAGKPIALDGDLAYADVLAAWRHYLTYDNAGRGFVLIGHSQGSRVLQRLVQEEIDGKPAQRQLVSALLIGFNLAVPSGQVVGGAFRTVPLCRSSAQTGCVVAYSTFRAEAPPPANSRFGRIAAAGMANACVNPAAPAGGKAALRAYFPTRVGLFPNMAVWSALPGVRIETPFVAVPGLIRAECRSDAHGSYLAVSVASEHGDRRSRAIPGEIVEGGKPLPDWGMHPADMHLLMGDLVALVGTQARAYAAR